MAMTDFQQSDVSPEVVLKQFWGYDRFRSKQGDIVRAVLAKQDTLALLPTGGGKSVCFQVPALCMPGICIVISPLLALMDDQVRQLRKRGIQAHYLHSGMSRRETDIVLDNCIYGEIKFLYVSPERLRNELFQTRVKKMRVNLIAVDEAHCISQWGYDFRPDYLLISQLRTLHPEVPVLALTASATPKVVNDIQEKLLFRHTHVISISFARENLVYIVRKEENKEQKLLDICKSMTGSGIVYCASRARTKEMSTWLNAHGVQSTFYHAGMPREEREQSARLWFDGQRRVICATNAFGMGIDKPDVRFVLHADVPQNPENYFQEAGRGGRDGQRAYAGLLWRDSDLLKLDEQLAQRFPEKDTIRKVYKCLMDLWQLAIGAGFEQTFAFDMKELAQRANVPHVVAHASLQLLERSGYLSLMEDSFTPSRLHIPVNKDQLYNFQVAQPAQESFLRLILRMYGGLFETFVTIREGDIAQAMKTTRDAVVQRLQLLMQLGMLHYEPQNALPRITMLTGRQNETHLIFPPEVYEHRKSIEEQRLNAMKRYLQEERCRSVQLLEYFGEKQASPCGMCDVCKSDNSTDERIVEELIQLVNEKLNHGPMKTDALCSTLKVSPALLAKAIAWQTEQGFWKLSATMELSMVRG